MKVDRCSTCRAEIVWARTAKGKSMPVDSEPPADGSGTVLLIHSEGEQVYATVRHRPAPGLRTSHFATCPDAGLHRRKR